MLHFFKKVKKNTMISLFYTCVPKTLMISSTVPEMWRVINWNWYFWVIFSHFEILKNQKNEEMSSFYKCVPKIKIIGCTVPEIQSETDWFFFVILGHILPFYPPNNLENQNFEKMKKVHGHSIILHVCTINDNHIMYGSWDMECDRQNFGPFFALLPPPPPNNPKNQILKKRKNA